MPLIFATCCAANVAAYVVWGSWISVASAVFAALMAIVTAINEEF